MTKRNWTKGPWYSDDLYVGGDKNQSIYTGARKENGKRVKDIESFWNARLISAAPEMFEAVDEILLKLGDKLDMDHTDLYKKLLWIKCKVGA